MTGCGSNPKTLQVDVAAVERTVLVLPTVDTIAMDDIYWYIVTEETAPAVFVELQENQYDPVLFGLTDRDYRKLGINQQKILGLIRQQRAVIAALKAYYMDSEPDSGTSATD
jgi:hypothetical protein